MIDSNRAELIREQRQHQLLARVSQIISFLFGIVYTGLLLRLALALMAARSSAPFVQFIRSITDPLYAPFRGIVDSPAIAEGGHTLALPIVVAIVVYALVHFGIRSFLRMLVERQTEI